MGHKKKIPGRKATDDPRSGGKPGGGRALKGPGNAYPVEFRMRVVREVVERKTSLYQLSKVFGPSPQTIERWVEAYKANGIDGLIPDVPFGRRAEQVKEAQAEPKRDAVVGLREEHPEYGTRRIRDVLRRFEALGVSETEVRRILHEEGLIETPPPPVAREHGPRRFERAQPNQLWQSDIFTFLLRRFERLYLTVFMDDHSRFIVSHALAHHQRSELVMEALERGVAAFGTPREILTDNGRQ